MPTAQSFLDEARGQAVVERRIHPRIATGAGNHHRNSSPLRTRTTTQRSPSPPSTSARSSFAGAIEEYRLPREGRCRQIKRFKVRDEFGNCVVARLHGRYGDKTALILPDGQLGFSNRLVPTQEPFQPLSADQLANLLQDGPFAEYSLLKTDHYLIFYKSTLAFAQDSGRLLDDLYKGLIEAFRRNGFPVHDTSSPWSRSSSPPSATSGITKGSTRRFRPTTSSLPIGSSSIKNPTAI